MCEWCTQYSSFVKNIVSNLGVREEKKIFKNIWRQEEKNKTQNNVNSRDNDVYKIIYLYII